MELSTYLRKTPGEGLGQGAWCGREGGPSTPQGCQGPLTSRGSLSRPGSVLYISLHRYDHGTFFPMGDEGASSQMGRAAGTGFTVNVAWNGPRVGDADYLAAWHRLVLPIAYEVQYGMHVAVTTWGSAGLRVSDFRMPGPVAQPMGGCCDGRGGGVILRRPR